MKLSKQESLEWIASRRSIYPRQFESNEVSEEELLLLLEAAQWAPTHKLTQPWRFVVFTQEAKMELAQKQGEAFINAKGASEQSRVKTEKFRLNAERSAAVVAVIMQRDAEKRIPEFEEICAVACAVQNVWTHAASLGLAGYWSTGAATDLPAIRALLNLKADDRHLGWFYVGRYSGELTRPGNRRTVTEFVEILQRV